MPAGKARVASRLKIALMAGAALALPAYASAQETGDAPPPQPTLPANVEGPKTYTPADFARFAPRNALDMLRQVPGFNIKSGEDRRGLGEAAGNILINGRRVAGKSNDASTELGRIPVANVLRIEIVDGATLDVPGLSGQVANVVAKLGGTSAQFAWRPEMRARYGDTALTRGEASVSGSRGPFAYTIGLRNDAFRAVSAGPAILTRPDGTLIDRREELVRFAGDSPKLSGSLKYDGPGSSVGNLNLSYSRFWYDNSEVSERSGPGQVDRVRRISGSEDEYNYEIGGDYELGFGPGKLKLIGLHRFEHSPTSTIAITSFADQSPASGNRFVRRADEAESIARAEYRWKQGVADWQVSVEGAFNSLDNVSDLATLLPSGEFREVPLPGGTARVAEDRAEARLTYGRPITPLLSVQASVGAEYSKLSVGGDANPARTFYRPKGFLSAAWKASPRLDLNARIERAVGQLDFYDFLASENLQNDSRDAANAELVPPQSWEMEVSGTRNLGAYGSTTARLFTRFLTDVIDQIPIGETGEAVGNLDSATVYGMESRSTFLLDALGWRGAKLDARFSLENSSLEDPLTGEIRRISGSKIGFAELSLRHDVNGTDWAWGSSVSRSKNGQNVRLGEVSLSREGPAFGSLFVEHKNVHGLTVKGTLSNIYGASNRFERIVYAGRRTGLIAFAERRRRETGPTISLSISGSL